MRTFKEIFEASEYKIYMIDNTFWVAYGDGSGTTSVIKKMESFLTDKSGDSHYDTVVHNVLKFAKSAKAIMTKKSKDRATEYFLYEMPFYLYSDVRQGKMDVWGGTIKPNKMYYMLLTKEKDFNIVSFFTKKGEAQAYVKTLA